MDITADQIKAAREEVCCHILNHFLFDKVWNEVDSEYRVNIKPILMNKHSVVGSFGLLDATIKLPTGNNSYYVWVISSETFNIGLKLPADVWTNCEEIANTYNTLLHMYSKSGSMLHKKYTYLRYNQSKSVILIAAQKDMVRACVHSFKEVTDDMYLTIYYDSDVANPVTVFSAQKTTGISNTNFQKFIDKAIDTASKDDVLQIYKNGVEVTPYKYQIPFQDGDFIDIVVDENIAFSIDLDLTYTNQNPVYLSDKDHTWKQILHIDKKYNPDNKIITHNTCDFWIRRRLSKEPYGKYLHRVKLDNSSRDTVTQVTHNDMSIPLYVLDAYRDYLEAEELTVHLVGRIHDKDNVLIRDASFIDLLYTHNDADIKRILSGHGPETLPWWKASELEKSKYIEMMFDIPNIVTTGNIKEYVEALGFYQVVNLLCKRVVDTTITDAFKGTLVFSLPLLYLTHTVIPVVYLNGKVLSKNKFTYTNLPETNQCNITIADGVQIKPGDLFTCVFYLDGDKNIYSMFPTEASTTITIPFRDFTIWAEEEVSESVHGVDHTYTKRYKPLEEITHYVAHANDKGSYDVTVAPEFIGKTILIQNKYCSYRQTYNLKEYTTTGKTISIPLIVPATDKSTNTEKLYPAFNLQNISVYVNGEYLVRNIEYFINTVKDDTGLFSHELIIQSMDHFTEGSDDTCDVVINIAESEDISSFFVINNELRDETPVNLYFPNISLSHVDGILERNADYKGVYMKLPENTDHKYKQGDIFEIQTSVPALIKDFILQYVSNEDFTRIKLLNDYFYGKYKLMPDVLVMEDKHRLYSVFMNTFIHDVLSGIIPVHFDPDVDHMNDIIKPYLYLKDMDLCFRMLDTNNQVFIDFYPQYVNYSVEPETKRFIDYFIKTYMPKNIDPTVEVVHG